MSHRSDAHAEPVANTSSERCPVCTRPTVPSLKPFCSPRCRDRDLLNWLDEAYRVPGAPVDSSADVSDE